MYPGGLRRAQPNGIKADRFAVMTRSESEKESQLLHELSLFSPLPRPRQHKHERFIGIINFTQISIFLEIFLAQIPALLLFLLMQQTNSKRYLFHPYHFTRWYTGPILYYRCYKLASTTTGISCFRIMTSTRREPGNLSCSNKRLSSSADSPQQSFNGPTCLNDCISSLSSSLLLQFQNFDL